MFITEEDYKVVIGEAALRVVSQTDTTNRQNAEAEAIEEISGYLRPKYDCAAIFAAEGENRNKQIVITRKERYDQAIKWLEKVQAGTVTPDLPLAEDEDGQQIGQKLHWGSAKRLKNIW